MKDNALELALALVSRRRRLLWFVGILLAIVMSHWLLADRKFRALASFSPETEPSALSGIGALGGLASAVGLNVGPGTSLDFYVELMRSDAFLRRLIEVPLTSGGVEEDSTTATLLDWYAGGESPYNERSETAAKEVLKATIISLNRSAGLITVEFTATEPGLSSSVANAYLELVNDFNVVERQSRGRALLHFLEDVAGPRASGELHAAEDSLVAFYERNRSLGESSLLRAEESRLQRRISIKQQAYLEVAAQVEQARVQAIRDTPVITVVSPASTPPWPISPLLHVNGPVGVVIALSLWFFSVLASEYWKRLRHAHTAEMALLMREMRVTRKRA